jgi:hypothetical protein
MTTDDLERRHDALVAQDREVGLAAEAEAARAEAERLRAELAVAQGRLDRKNARIKQLAARVAELESQQAGPPVRRPLSRLGRRTPG